MACHICHQPAEGRDKGRLLFIHHQKFASVFYRERYKSWAERQRGDRNVANTHITTKIDWQKKQKKKHERTQKGKKTSSKSISFLKLCLLIFDTSRIRRLDISVCRRGHCAGLSNRSGTNSSPDLVVSRNEDWQRYKHKPQLIGIHEADSL